MTSFVDYTIENKTENNSKLPYIPDLPYNIFIIGASGSVKRNALLNLIDNQPDIDKIYLYGEDAHEGKYYLINKREKVGLKHFNDPKAFIKYSDESQNVYKLLENTK